MLVGGGQTKVVVFRPVGLWKLFRENHLVPQSGESVVLEFARDAVFGGERLVGVGRTQHAHGVEPCSGRDAVDVVRLGAEKALEEIGGGATLHAIFALVVL